MDLAPKDGQNHCKCIIFYEKQNINWPYNSVYMDMDGRFR